MDSLAHIESYCILICFNSIKKFEFIINKKLQLKIVKEKRIFYLSDDHLTIFQTTGIHSSCKGFVPNTVICEATFKRKNIYLTIFKRNIEKLFRAFLLLLKADENLCTVRFNSQILTDIYTA